MPPKTGKEAVERDEFRTPCSPETIRFMQVTNDPKRDSTVAAQYIIRWSPDSKRFYFYRAASDDGSSPAGIWVCDTEDRFAIRPVYEWADMILTHRPYGPEAVGKIADTYIVFPDGLGIGVMRRNRDVLELCRVDAETRREEVLMTAPAPLATGWLLDISADGQHVAFHVFLGDGKTEGAPWGARVFDLKGERTWVVELDNLTHKGVLYRRGSGFCPEGLHPGPHDLMTHISPASRLADGSWRTPPDGSYRHPMPGPDTSRGWGHQVLFRDDGSDYPRTADAPRRIVPLPAAPLFQVSHAGWRGREARTYVASMYNCTPQRWRVPFIESTPVAMSAADLRASRLPAEARWTDLTRFVSRADACHFDFDASGRYLVSDTDGYTNPGPCMLYVGTYVEPEFGDDPYFKLRLLGIARTSWKNQSEHPHPFLSPDGRFAVFQSDFSGRPQVNVAYGFDFP